MVTVNRDIRDHTLLAIRALATGWALYVVLSFPVTWLTGVSTTFINTWLWTFQHASSWTVFWADRVASTCVIGLACAVSGWIVARLHSAHAATMVCLYAASVLVFEYGFMSWMFWRYGHPPMPWTMLVLPAILILSRPLGILIGGLSVRPDPNSFVPRSV